MFADQEIAAYDHELKFVVAPAQLEAVETYVRHRLKKDPKHPVGIVSSIYYDTPRLEYLFEKFNSDYLKTKVRARWYQDLSFEPVDDVVFAEAKFRIGSRRTKVRLKTALDGSWLQRQSLTSARLLSVPLQLNQAGLTLHQPLMPFMVVKYKRQRFVEPFSNARIAIDTAISAGSINPFFGRVWSPRQLDLAVVEVKSTERRLPESFARLSVLGAQRASFSKYSACFEAATQHAT